MRNKSVLVLGNGPNDIDPSDYDCVIRFGVGLNGGPCDIWVANFMTRGGCHIKDGTFYRTNTGHSATVPITLFPFEYIIRLSQDQTQYPDEWKSVTCFVGRDKWNNIRRDLYHQPLTGSMFLYWVINYGPKDIELNVAGFDGFKTNNVFHNLGTPRVHKLDVDRKVFNKWIEEKKFKLL